MKKSGAIIMILSLCSVLISSCAGDQAIDQVYEYMDRTLSIIEAHKDNPPKAADEVNKYIMSIQNQLDKVVEEFEADKERTTQLAQKLKPLFKRQELLLKNSPTLRKNIRIQQTLVIFEVLAYPVQP
ncbi:MAG: hypothetical protein JW822_12550 [Spirochaetales bacterium]|nr:hypothetical protein [Spirochaetales bacterium]